MCFKSARKAAYVDWSLPKIKTAALIGEAVSGNSLKAGVLALSDAFAETDKRYK